ncbi:MAG TPA: hypothetical protein ENG16_00810 [Archaeoglobus sp.]|nr:hypothetical protein [Archaeoglobus sp.]
MSVKWSSPSRQFNVTPDILYLNWTNDYSSNITITKNDSLSSLTIEITNGTDLVYANYSQTGQPSSLCAPSYYRLFVIGPSGYNNTIGVSNSVNVTIADEPIDSYDHTQCLPGRYWIQNLHIRNATQTTENTSITVFIDIPISQENNDNLLSKGTASFNGVLSENSTIYHSYFFNITELSDGSANVTGVAINLSLSSGNADLFLFDDSQVLKAKSINSDSQNELLIYNFLPYNSAMWEIRIYGNSTSQIPYEGYVIFTGLNFLNASNRQRISNLDFGTRNASYQQTLNITLKNELNISSPSITQSIVLYQVKRFNGSGAKNFTFFVPDSSIANKIKASLYWNGDSNYSINVYDEDGDLVGSSINKHVNAKKVGVEREEYVETTSIGSKAGFWRIEVKNHTTTTDPYNLTVRIYVSSSDWFETNFSQVSLNGTNQINNSTDIQINLTVPNNTMNGTYEGYIQYLDSRNGGIRIPLRISVTTPMLIVNDTMSSMTAKVDENYGANLTKTVTFFLNNTGDLDLSVSLTNSSGKLTCVSGTGCSSGYFANFTYNQITSIPKNSYKILQVNISFNSSMPKGIYQGWITIWGNNSNVELSAHPYSTFNITLKLNLTDLVKVDVFGVKTADGNTMIENSSKSENVTANVELYYINGTKVELENALNTSNFTVWLVNKNVTSYRIPASGSLSLFNGTTPLYISLTGYSINFTVPANKPGGYYDVYVSTSFEKNG